MTVHNGSDSRSISPPLTVDTKASHQPVSIPSPSASSEDSASSISSIPLNQINDESEEEKKPSTPKVNFILPELNDGSTVSTTDRVCKDVLPPISRIPTEDEIFVASTTSNPRDVSVNLKFLKYHFFREGRIHPDHAIKIVSLAKIILRSEPNVLRLKSPIAVAGDIHGQYYDLLKLFEVGGDPETCRYLFLGDYVDRGYFSCETLLYLLAIKVNRPDSFFMLRGNHECKHLTEYFTFKTECLKKYTEEVYNSFVDLFCNLPLAAVINQNFFCVHGGLSPQIKTIEDINALDRKREPPSSGPMCDLLWSDPTEDFGKENENYPNFKVNPVRGCSYSFSFNAVTEFLDRNKFLSIIRAHEAQDCGYRIYKKVKSTDFPALMTLFSAPNYLDMYNNKAAILKFDQNIMNIRQFNASPHPYWLPNFMDVFTWSMPFVGEKLTDLLLAMMSICSNEELEAFEDAPVNIPKSIKSKPMPSAGVEERRRIIRNKILAIGRLSRLFAILRDEKESISELKLANRDRKLPAGTLWLGSEGIRNAITSYDDIRKLDLPNERMPPNVHVVQSAEDLSPSLAIHQEGKIQE